MLIVKIMYKSLPIVIQGHLRIIEIINPLLLPNKSIETNTKIKKTEQPDLMLKVHRDQNKQVNQDQGSKTPSFIKDRLTYTANRFNLEKDASARWKMKVVALRAFLIRCNRIL